MVTPNTMYLLPSAVCSFGSFPVGPPDECTLLFQGCQPIGIVLSHPLYLAFDTKCNDAYLIHLSS